ncbi:Hypothetical predicted protein [Lecanosticta acicola]|uniref:Uncharacterized protein n=1 Tax=Lecanosticta acicola TaxID=111012 RepID=A0AAI8YYA0_9PEZI|nr:Hypothetical predicted protein [Lecanosticta acicola]
MAPPHRLPDYNKRSCQQLRNLIRRRTGETVQVTETKASYIHKLTLLDCTTPFRFLDLAPELRNSIYEFLLVRDPDDEDEDATAHPALLRTCKQIYAEGKGILYAESVLQIESTFFNSYDILRCLRRRRGFLPPGREPRAEEIFTYGYFTWRNVDNHESRLPHEEIEDVRSSLQPVRAIRKISLAIRLLDSPTTFPRPTCAWRSLYHFLDGLTDVLRNLRLLRIHFSDQTTRAWKGGVNVGLIKSLAPLAGLPKRNCAVQLYGVSEGTVRAFWQMAAAAAAEEDDSVGGKSAKAAIEGIDAFGIV